jgi:hypothetical protein
MAARRQESRGKNPFAFGIVIRMRAAPGAFKRMRAVHGKFVYFAGLSSFRPG